jgi:hypothetical protein
MRSRDLAITQLKPELLFTLKMAPHGNTPKRAFVGWNKTENASCCQRAYQDNTRKKSSPILILVLCQIDSTSL